MFSPILITPSDFQYSPKLPTFGNRIKQDEEFSPQNTIRKEKVIFFIGGFMDSFTRALFEYFLQFSHQDFAKFYGTYDSAPYLDPILQTLQEKEIYFISHSWGACNTIKLLARTQAPIKHLLTLDDVSYTSPLPLHQVKYWENVYITSHYSLDRSNLVALIGHPQKSIKYANINIPLDPPYTHTSIKAMLERSKLYAELGLIH